MRCLGALLSFLAACGTSGGAGEAVSGGTDLTLEDGLLGPVDLVWDGEAWAVVYALLPASIGPDEPGDDILVFARVDPDGVLLSPPENVAELGLDASDVRITTTASGYLVWYREGGDSNIFTLPLSSTGMPTGPPTEVVAVRGSDPDIAIAFDGSSYGLVFIQARSPDDIAFQRVDAMGGAVGTPVVIEERGTNQNDPSIAPTGTPGLFTVVWNEAGRVWSGALDADGTVVTAGAGVADQTRNLRPRVAMLDESAFVVGSLDTDYDTHRFYYVRDATPVYPEPVVALPESRADRIQWDMEAHEGTVDVVFTSDAVDAVPQVTLATFGTEAMTLTTPERLTNPRYSWHRAEMARGPDGLGLLVGGLVDGTHRLYFLSRPD